MAQMFSAQPANDLPVVPNFNVCPTTPVCVVRASQSGRQLRAMRWGFVPHWYKTINGGPLLVNARAETLAQKPAFRAACRSQRCLVVGNGYFEWTKDAQGNRRPWYFYRADGAPIAFAALWQAWGDAAGEPIVSCAMVTTPANPEVSPIHHRMPLMISPPDWAMWLGEQGKGAARLMAPCPEGVLRWHPVSSAVNSNRATGDKLIERCPHDHDENAVIDDQPILDQIDSGQTDRGQTDSGQSDNHPINKGLFGNAV
jgi:putative SOS response-associated peptidase YedK